MGTVEGQKVCDKVLQSRGGFVLFFFVDSFDFFFFALVWGQVPLTFQRPKSV